MPVRQATAPAKAPATKKAPEKAPAPIKKAAPKPAPAPAAKTPAKAPAKTLAGSQKIADAIPKKKATDTATYDYTALLINIRAHIDEKFGKLSEFLSSDTFGKMFETTPEKRKQIQNLLSYPAAGQEKKVRSFPVLQSLYKTLMKTDLTSELEIVRKVIITGPKGMVLLEKQTAEAED